MFLLYTFAEFHPLSSQQIRQRFGGKALGLYEAFQLGIPVPSTWMISAQDHEAFLKTGPSTEPESFQKEAKEFIQNHLGASLKAVEGQKFAVRSSCQSEDSAEHSFAGIFETRINVPTVELAEAIAFVWSSPLLARALSYSQIQTLMGVLIQPMVDAKSAGICFTANPSPTNIFENQTLVVEYAPTIGEKVVQGEVTPFRLCGSADVLSSVSENGWMDELLKAIFDLKKRHRREVDIEFAIDGQDNFILLQQRPISKIYPSFSLDLSCYKRMYTQGNSKLGSRCLKGTKFIPNPAS